MKVYKKILIILFVSALLFSACGEKAGEKNKNTKTLEVPSSENELEITAEQFRSAGMKLGKITNKSFSERIQVTGMIDVPPEYKAAVGVYYGGTVKKIHLLVGQKIRKGETLFILENPEYVEMQQNYLNAKNKLNYLKAEYERQKTLLQENISSQKKFLKAESDYNTVLTDFEALSKKLRLININTNNLDYNSISSSIKIKAPISGNISEINITLGQFLSPDKIAVSIIGTEHIHLELNVFEKDIHKIRKGQTITFTLPDSKSQTFEAEVFLVGQSVQPTDRTINIHGHLKNESDEVNFIPGMFVQAEILIDEAFHPAIPANAIVNIDDSYFVLVKDSNNNNKYTFRKQLVKVGKTTNGHTEIMNIDEFKEGNEILIKGAFNLIQ